ncbi:MAG: WD40 repeat protein/serine/threonine protein kinase [Mariniblastus sp.]|jgi:WD40 repeat protein/serine/threonine protein kinase
MLDCLFCKFEYDVENLIDDRCPNCGGIVQWSSDEAEEPSVTPMVTVSLGPSFLANHLNRPIEDLKEPPKVEEEIEPPKATTVSCSQTVMPRELQQAIQGKDTDPQYQKSLSTDDIEQLGGIWKLASMKTSNPMTTLRTNVEESSQSIEVVINQRSFKETVDQSTMGMDYEILNQIGKGAVGIVYAAQQNSINRNVAVKMLNAEASEDEAQKEKFLFEAIVTGDLDHPNIVPIHELGKNQNGDLFYSMKQVVGTPWSDSIGKKALSENLEILLKICDAISFAHARGIVHRDLKPENVMLGEFGEVLVVDWGIALPFGGFSKMTELLPQPGIAGTPAYMAPEMATGPLSKIGPHSDVYLLGAMLYEIVVKAPPHRGGTVMDCVIAAATNVIVPTDESGELIDIAYHAMATEPEDRFGSASELKSALHDYQSHIESITLTERAQSGFQQAVESNDYSDYSRAAFAFQEALDLWDGNTVAHAGLRQANLSYAKCALDKSDFELGLSLVDSADFEFEPIEKSLRSGLEARNKRQTTVKLLRNMSIALVLALIGGGTLFSLSLNNARKVAENAKVKADNEKVKAETERGKALTAAERAEEAANDAREAEDLAKTQKQFAVIAKSEAVAEKIKADEEKIKADQATNRLAVETYYSEIGSVTEKINQQAFAGARSTVDKIRVEASRLGLGIRHWEWGRLNQLCNGSNQERIVDDQRKGSSTSFPINALATNDDDTLLAVGGSKGQVDLFFVGSETSKQSLEFKTDQGKALVYDLAFSPDNKQLLAAGSINSEGWLAIWNLPINANQEPDVTRKMHAQAVTCMSFSPAGNALLTGSEDKTLKLWEFPFRGEAPQLVRTFSGHDGPVWDCDFNPNESKNQFVSCSEDKTVRIWSWSLDGRESSEHWLFKEHQKPVYSVAFSKNGNQIASAGMEREIKIWSVNDSAYTTVEYYAKIEKQIRSIYPESNLSNAELVAEIEKQVRLMNERRASRSNTDKRKKWQAITSDSRVVGQHANSIRVLEFSENGEFLLSAGDDNIVNVWNIEISMTPERSFRGHGSWVRGAKFAGERSEASASRCPPFIYSGGYDNEIFKWTVDKLLPTGELDLGEPVVASTVSPRGDRLVTAMVGGDSKVWDLTTMKQVESQVPGLKKLSLVEGHEYLCSRAIFTPAGTEMLTAGGDNFVILWDVVNGVEIRRWQDTGRRSLLSLSDDGSLFAAGDSKNEVIKVFQVDGRNSREPIRLKPGSGFKDFDVTTISLSPDGEFLVAGDSYGRCYVWRLKDNRFMGFLKAHRKALVDVHCLPVDQLGSQGLSFVTAGREGDVIRWSLMDEQNPNLANGNRQFVPLVGGPKESSKFELSRTELASASVREGMHRLTHMEFNSLGSAALIVFQKENESLLGSDGKKIKVTPDVHLRLVDLLDDKLIASANIAKARVSTAVFDPRNPEEVFLAVDKPDAKPRATTNIYRWQTGRHAAEPERFIVTNKSTSIAQLGHSSTEAAIMTVAGKGVEFWNYETNRTRKLRSHGIVNCINYSPEGDLILTGGPDGSAKIWDAETSTPVFKLEPVGLASVTAVGFANHSKIALVANENGDVYRYSSETGKLLDVGAFCQHGALVDAVCVSPDDRFLLTAGIDKRVMVWDFESGENNTVLLHEDRVLCISFSANGQLLLSGCADNLAYLWETRHWEQDLDGVKRFSGGNQLSGHAAEVVSVEFSRDRIRALTASKDGTAKLWDLTKFLQPEQVVSSETSEVSTGQATARDPGEQFREIMTLSRQNEELVSAQFSNQGRDIVTTSRDGKATIWRGSGIPAAIGLSKRYVDQLPLQEEVLDAEALVLCPDQCDFENAVLVIEVSKVETITANRTDDDLQSKPRPGENIHFGRLGLLPQLGMNSDPGSIRREDSDLYYLPSNGGAREKIGLIRNAGPKMEIEFTNYANVDRVEQLIRAITFCYDANLTDNVNVSRQISFHFMDLSTAIQVRIRNSESITVSHSQRPWAKRLVLYLN